MSRTLWAAFYADGVLHGVTEDPRGSRATVPGRIGTASYWVGLHLNEDVDGFVVARLENVPDDVAEDLLTVGSLAQVIQDGYEAAGIAVEYWAEWTDWTGTPDLHAMDALVDDSLYDDWKALWEDGSTRLSWPDYEKITRR